jgi:hypothetical protein
MVFCAVLVGDAGNRLWKLYEAGTLFEQYNSERKTALTLLAVFGVGLATLCILEVVRIKRRVGPFRPLPRRDPAAPATDEPASTSIYTAPKVVDAWQDRREGSVMITSSRRMVLPMFQSFSMIRMWMSILRIYCGVLPVVYTYTLLNYLILWLPNGAGNIVLTILFPLLMLGSVMTSTGILRKKRWGMYAGYAMAVFHLLIFPFGTAAGFVMLIALLGATSEFSVPRRRIRRNT